MSYFYYCISLQRIYYILTNFHKHALTKGDIALVRVCFAPKTSVLFMYSSAPLSSEKNGITAFGLKAVVIVNTSHLSQTEYALLLLTTTLMENGI